VTTDASSTPTTVTFGTLAFDTEVEVAQRLNVTTNGDAGYSIYMYQRQGLVNGPEELLPVTGTNSTPSTWATGCVSTYSCYGYHAGDDSLSSGSARFAMDNSYAQFATSPEEIVYSNVPVTDEETDIVYKLQVTEDQIAGVYESSVVFIVVPAY
jgi:hypothetical protein